MREFATRRINKLKRQTAIFLLLLLVVSSSPHKQGITLIVKMGAFVHHFIHHISRQNERIGLSDFISLHYFDHKHHEEDHAGHKNLPFSHQHEEQKTNILQVVLYFIEMEHWAFFASAQFEKKQFPYQESSPSRTNFSIWKPPRFEV